MPLRVWLGLLTFFAITATCAIGRSAEARLESDPAQLLAEAERADATFEFARAEAAYAETARLDPTAARAVRAEARARAIRERAEGNFAPLVAFERVRRSAELSANPHAIDDLVRAANGFPPGLVRVESWMLAAEAYAHRLGRPNDAVPLWRRVVVDEHADVFVVNTAARALVDHHLAHGDTAAAEEALRLAGSKANPQIARDLHRRARRQRLHIASIVAVVVAAGAAAIALAKAARGKRLREVLVRARGSAGLILGYAGYVAIAGALLATGYQYGTARPFLLFGVVLVPILFLARAWGAAGSPERTARALRAALCFACALGAAFLVLESVDVGYLEGMGL